MSNGELRVTLVQAPRWTVYTPPYALAVLAGNLRGRGFSVAAKDYDIDLYHYVSEEDRVLWDDENSGVWDGDEAIGEVAKRYQDFTEKCVDDILATNPHVVGFSVKVRSRFYSLHLAEAVRRRSADVFIIFGGPEMNNGVDRYLTAHPFIDAIAMQEADISFPAFLEDFVANGKKPQPQLGIAYKDANGDVVYPGPITLAPDVDAIPLADYSDFDFNKYKNPAAITLMLSRGCINRCSFCSEAPSFLRYRYFPAQRVEEELRHVISNSNVQFPPQIQFNDSLINGNFDQMDELADRLIANPVPGLVFSGMMLMRDRMPDDLMRKLARAGLSEVFFGMETGSEAMVQIMRKKFKLETAERLLKVAHESGVKTTVSIIFGHPGETEAEYYNSINFIKKIYDNTDRLLVNILGIYGDSYLSRHLDEFDITNSDPRDWVGDNGLNTIEVRRQRKINAINLFGEKVADIGDFATLGMSDNEPITRMMATRGDLRRQPNQVLTIKNAIENGDYDEVLDFAHGALESCEHDEERGVHVAKGWAALERSSTPAPFVAFMMGSVVVAVCKPDMSRRDAVLRTGAPGTLMSGWQTEIDASLLTTGPIHQLRALAVDPERKEYGFLHSLVTARPGFEEGQYHQNIRPAEFNTLASMVLGIKSAVEGAAVFKETPDFAEGWLEYETYDPRTRTYLVSGWAIRPNSTEPVPRVAILSGGKVVAICVPTVLRRDVLEAKGASATFSGWEARIDARVLASASAPTFSALALDPETRRCAALSAQVKSSAAVA